MTGQQFAHVDVGPIWGRMNETIIDLIDYIPDDKMNWSPQENLWNFRGILLHTISTRDSWLGDGVKDGEASPTLVELPKSKDGMIDQLRRSWERVGRFLSDPEKLSRGYTRVRPATGDTFKFSGHWLAFHLLEHDLHHRADIFHYLALLGIEHPEVDTP